MVAGGAGGLTALLMKKVYDNKYWTKLKRMGGSAGRIANKTGLTYDQQNQFANPLLRYDVFIMGRGIIAGCIMVSAPSIHYKIWIALILGGLGGIVSILLAEAFHKSIDDPLLVF